MFRGSSVLVPIALLLAIIGGAVGYGELRGKAADNSRRISENEVRQYQDARDVAQWREAVTRSLARIEQRLRLEDERK